MLEVASVSSLSLSFHFRGCYRCLRGNLCLWGSGEGALEPIGGVNPGLQTAQGIVAISIGLLKLGM